jgi:hypothetical protein
LSKKNKRFCLPFSNCKYNFKLLSYGLLTLCFVAAGGGQCIAPLKKIGALFLFLIESWSWA